MTLEVTEPVPKDRPGDQAAAKLLDSSSLAGACASYVVLLLTPTGRYRRHVFLSLHSTSRAVQRAQTKCQPVRMVLCRLKPVEGGVAS
jgi:hypothetical protein